jgi:endonuclease I
MASPSLRDGFASTVELYSTFIKQMKTKNSQLNASEASFARRKSGKNSFGKRNSSGISNVSNAEVDDMFFEKHACHALTPEQNNALEAWPCLKSPCWKWQLHWEKQREGTYNQIPHPLHCGADYRN